MQFELTLYHWGPWGMQSNLGGRGGGGGGQPQSSLNPKILPTKVVGYDTLIIKIPLIGDSTYFVASGELLSEPTVLPLTPT